MDACFAGDVAGDPEFLGPGKHLRGHLFTAADEREGGAGEPGVPKALRQLADWPPLPA